jgi:hypothetical protein
MDLLQRCKAAGVLNGIVQQGCYGLILVRALLQDDGRRCDQLSCAGDLRSLAYLAVVQAPGKR